MPRRSIRCAVNERRFTVLRVNQDPSDTHAGRSFEEAWNRAIPDRGSTVEVFAVCTRDVGEARMAATIAKRGQLLRKFKHRGGR